MNQVIKQPYHTPSQAKARASARNLQAIKDEWTVLLGRYERHFTCSFSGTFVCELKDPWVVVDKARRFQRGLNKVCAGSNWEEKRGGVLSFFAVERGTRLSKRLHTYFLIGRHPRLVPPTLKMLWRRLVDKNVSFDALSVTPRDSSFMGKAIPYFVKQISLDPRWPDPEPYVPREFDDFPVDGEGRYLDPHTKIIALPDLMTVEELREHVPLSKSTIYKLVEERKIPHITIDRRILFDPSIVAEWLRSRTVDTTTIGNSPDERNLTNLQSDNLDVSMCSKPNENLMKDVDRILKSTSIGGLL